MLYGYDYGYDYGHDYSSGYGYEYGYEYSYGDRYGYGYGSLPPGGVRAELRVTTIMLPSSYRQPAWLNSGS